MPYGDTSPPAGGGARLEVDRVGFGYEPDRQLLRGVSFAVEPGHTVALVGATASGKSTLTTLLARLVDPDEGAIRVDGVDVRDLARGGLSALLSVVPQTAFLFDDTVRDNVTLGAEATDAEVWEALRTAQADAFVAALPEGLDTQLGERGTSLSGGQRQRIALARALVRRPRLLVLDDATSAVDPEVEARILAGLRTPSVEGSGVSKATSFRPADARTSTAGGVETTETPDTTLVVVAYRKATISLADDVLFLVDGVIADRGPHDELVARNPAYARLVNAYELGDQLVTEEVPS
jgi:ABC-type multidrug transport system fused ATPase/permease subunit